MAQRQADKATLVSVISQYEFEYRNRDYLAHSASMDHTEELGTIVEYLSKKGSNRRNYRHYATRKRVESIVDDSVLYLTDGSTWNDRYDKAHFNSSSSGWRRFGICLSATTSESIAMWMLYGGLDGNGAMVNFDKGTLSSAMSRDAYELGRFGEKGFEAEAVLEASDIDFKLVDVLYFSYSEDGTRVEVERVGEEKKAWIGAEAFEGVAQVAKHRAWSFESEVRLVASVSKLKLLEGASKATAIKIPLSLPDDFASTKVFDSPISDGSGHFRDSELLGTVDWNLCSDCDYKKGVFKR